MYAFSQPTATANEFTTARFSNDSDRRRLDGGAATHVGLVRMRNEDAWMARPDNGVFVVCDGMGGHAAGDVASQMAVETIESLSADITPVDDVPSRLSHAIWRANLDVFMAGRNPEYLGMGTTTVALWIGDERGVVAHVGDSRIYRQRGGRLTALTLDHSPVGDAVRNGRIDRQTAESLAAPPVITRSLGASVDVRVECTEIDVLVGDRYLLCTDGLTDLVAVAEICDVLDTQVTAGDAADALVRTALDRGGHDNVTAVVVDVR